MKGKRWVPLLLGLCVFVQIGALWNGFYWDDRPLILEGKLVHSFRAVPEIFQHEMWYNVDLGARAPQARIDTYRPISTLSFLIDHSIWGDRPSGYHLSNLLIHLLNVLLLFAILASLVGSEWAALSAVIFALHPLTVECVQYISARTDSLPALFGLLGIWVAIRYPNDRITPLGCFLFSMMSKETGIVFPILAYLVQVARGAKPRGPGLLGTIFLYFVLRRIALGGAKVFEGSTHVADVFLNYPRYLFDFVHSFLIPHAIFPMQEFHAVQGPGSLWTWIVAIVGNGGITAALIYGWIRKCTWLPVVAGILLPLALPLVVVSVTTETNPRYLYGILPAASVAFAFFLTRLPLCPAHRIAVWTGVLLGFAGMTFVGSRGYRTEESFYRKILTTNPASMTGHYNLANTLSRSGRWEEAIPSYERLVKERKENPSYWNNLAVAYLNVGRLRDAEQAVDQAIRLDSAEGRYEYNQGLILHALGRPSESAQAFFLAVRAPRPYPKALPELQRFCASLEGRAATGCSEFRAPSGSPTSAKRP
ncbi:MAG: tetratricopeptide repeat protein [Pseudomonadota bacterium]